VYHRRLVSEVSRPKHIIVLVIKIHMPAVDVHGASSCGNALHDVWFQCSHSLLAELA
jgi:hypothetical protein